MKRTGRAKKSKVIEDVIEPAPIRSKSFAYAFPEAARQWLYKKNCGFGPEDFSYGSEVKAWFKCPAAKDHVFQIAIKEMSKAFRTGTWTQGCSFCRGLKASVTNNLAYLYPELAKEWMTRKNRLRPETGIDPFAIPDKTKIVWRCARDPSHGRWISSFVRTTHTQRCPSCLNRRGSKYNNLKITHPEIAKQWDKLKNGALKPEMVTEGSHKQVFWKCKEGPDHEWSTKVVDRTRTNTRCPFCAFRKRLSPTSWRLWHRNLLRSGTQRKTGKSLQTMKEHAQR